MQAGKDGNLINRVIGELSELDRGCARFNTELLPIRQEVTRLIRDLQTILFPRFFPNPRADEESYIRRFGLTSAQLSSDV